MKRREFITLLGGGAVAWPPWALAQPMQRRRLGVLMNLAADDAEGQARITAFAQALKQLTRTVTSSRAAAWYATDLISLTSSDGRLSTLIAYSREKSRRVSLIEDVLNFWRRWHLRYGCLSGSISASADAIFASLSPVRSATLSDRVDRRVHTDRLVLPRL
jgi:hypothetical protein